MEKIIITSYRIPDIDWVACALWYEEYLNKTGIPAISALPKTLTPESEWVLDFIEKKDIKYFDEYYSLDAKIILVDTSDPTSIDQKIQKEQVIEVIDHRKFHHADEFINAKQNIELVGSASTLIAEKFSQNSITPSREVAVCLYAAIVSNTIWFQADVTTQRDKDMAHFLLPYCNIPNTFIQEMFEAKSKVDKPLQEFLFDELVFYNFWNYKVWITQIEIYDGKSFVQSYKQEIIEILDVWKKEKHLDFIFCTLIDIKNLNNIFLTHQETTQEILQKILDVNFVENEAKNSKIILRKQITPQLDSIFQKL